jgi:hypothetical protein
MVRMGEKEMKRTREVGYRVNDCYSVSRFIRFRRDVIHVRVVVAVGHAICIHNTVVVVVIAAAAADSPSFSFSARSGAK